MGLLFSPFSWPIKFSIQVLVYQVICALSEKQTLQHYIATVLPCQDQHKFFHWSWKNKYFEKLSWAKSHQ